MSDSLVLSKPVDGNPFRALVTLLQIFLPVIIKAIAESSSHNDVDLTLLLLYFNIANIFWNPASNFPKIQTWSRGETIS